MPQISVKCVIWDYGNTLLLDPFPEILEKIASKCTALLKKYGYVIREDAFINEWKKANKKINYPHASHFVQEEPILAEALKSLKVLPKDSLLILPNMLGIYRRGFKRHVKNEPRNKEVKQIVSWVKKQGFRQAVLSNGRMLDPKPAVALIGIEKYFDFVFSSEEIDIEKPDPEIFENVLRILNLNPADCIYIGDDPIRDIECAKKKGLFAVLYKRPEKESMPWRNYNIKPKFLPDAEINSLADLKNILVLKK